MNKIEYIKDILQKEGNMHTKVTEVDSTKGAYYSYLTDTIYISSDTAACKEKDIVVMCHECIHTMQDKRLHIANVVLSNMEIALFVIAAACIAFGCFNIFFLIIYILCNAISIAIRCVLELPAMTGAFELAKKHADKQRMVKKIEKEQMKINKMLVLGVLSFTWPKLFRLVLIILLFCLI